MTPFAPPPGDDYGVRFPTIPPAPTVREAVTVTSRHRVVLRKLKRPTVAGTVTRVRGQA